jgi:nucleotide-binding universal stress UspA family protein
MRVLAAIDDSSAALPVVRTARAIATRLGAELEAVNVNGLDRRTSTTVAEIENIPLRILHGHVVRAIVEAARPADVGAVVLGARGSVVGPRPAGSTALELIAKIDRPVVVVPPDLAFEPGVLLHRLLVPLDGSEDAATAGREAVRWFREDDCEVVVLHVFAGKTVPRFWDQPQHAAESWAQAFLEHFSSDPAFRCELRCTAPGAGILETADTEGVDVIALGWSRNLSAGRAHTVQAVLADAHVPVLLIPVDTITADRELIKG